MRERSVVTQFMMSPYGLNGMAGGSVNGCNGRLEARGGEHVNAKRGGKSNLCFDAWPLAGRGRIYTRQVCYVGGNDLKTRQDKERTEVSLILLYTARMRTSPATCGPENGVARDVRDVGWQVSRDTHL